MGLSLGHGSADVLDRRFSNEGRSRGGKRFGIDDKAGSAWRLFKKMPLSTALHPVSSWLRSARLLAGKLWLWTIHVQLELLRLPLQLAFVPSYEQQSK